MERIVIGVDPHKLSATIEVVDRHENVLASGRFATDKAGYAAMRRQVAAWPERTWAVEGSNGAGRPLAQRLLANGEHVVDVPAKLAARARMLDTGHGRKTDAHDAHSVAVAAVRAKELRVLALDPQLEALRMLVDRREQLTDLVAIEKRIKSLSKELKGRVADSGSTLMDLPGVGPIVAARVLADVGDVTRFADRNRFASWTGTAPIEASSGEQVRHRLSRAGNRRMNHMLHIAAATQIRLDTEGRRYYRRKLAQGKTRMEAMRCLKRRISDAIYRQLVADARRAALNNAPESSEADPGGHRGATQKSSAVNLPPHIDTSDQPLPGPATTTLQPGPGLRNSANKQPLGTAS